MNIQILSRRKRNKVKLSKLDIAFNIVNYTLLILLTIACVFPFYYLFINTISSNELVRLGHIQLYPQQIHFENYIQVFKLNGIADAPDIAVRRGRDPRKPARRQPADHQGW